MNNKYYNLTVYPKTKDRTDELSMALRKACGRSVFTDELVNMLLNTTLAGRTPKQFAKEYAETLKAGNHES